MTKTGRPKGVKCTPNKQELRDLINSFSERECELFKERAATMAAFTLQSLDSWEKVPEPIKFEYQNLSQTIIKKIK